MTTGWFLVMWLVLSVGFLIGYVTCAVMIGGKDYCRDCSRPLDTKTSE